MSPFLPQLLPILLQDRGIRQRTVRVRCKARRITRVFTRAHIGLSGRGVPRSGYATTSRIPGSQREAQPMTSCRLPPVRAGDEAASGKERSQGRMPEEFCEATPEDDGHVAEEAEPDHSPGAMEAIDFRNHVAHNIPYGEDAHAGRED